MGVWCASATVNAVIRCAQAALLTRTNRYETDPVAPLHGMIAQASLLVLLCVCLWIPYQLRDTGCFDEDGFRPQRTAQR